ncbi:MAG: HEAT repeat domain-containing protein [Pseudomonadota bacterium]
MAHFAAGRVGAGLSGVARHIPSPPDAALPGTVGMDGFAPARGVDDTGGDGPRLDLEHPTERDWRFLEQTLREGTPEARRSATKAMVIAGGLRGVEPLFAAAAQPGEDADLYCFAALDILRLQRWEDTLPALLRVMLEEANPPSQRCRSVVAGRFVAAGGRDPERLEALAASEDPRIRAFVAGYIAETAPAGGAALLQRLAQDPDPAVRLRTGIAQAPPEESTP